MQIKPKLDLCLLGCGEVFEALQNEISAYGWDAAHVQLHRFASVDDIAAQADTILSKYDPKAHTLFIAVDANAMNYARLELYGKARLRGFRMHTLVHPSVISGADTKWADNVWIGPGTLLATKCHIESNSFIGQGSRLDSHVHVGAHVWVGAGARIGAHSRISNHCVLGSDVIIKTGAELGSHVLLDQIGPWEGSLPAGTLLESGWSHPAQMIGPGYTFQRKQSA
jgi:acetyltransferase-like isoleucine patch superfamily enzyme